MQCQGINKNGHQCHRMVKGKRCWQHQQVVIYTLPTCSYCIKAKKLLKARHMNYKEIIVTPSIMKQLIKKTGIKTVPQIFINNKFIGGYTDLLKL